MSLRACTSCRRLVRVHADRCPFCSGALAAMPTALPTATPMVRRARAVLFAGAIGATAIGGAACTKEPQGQPPQIPPQPEPTAVAMYGAPAPPPDVDAGATVLPPQPGPPPTGPVAMYGAAPPPRKP